MSTAPFAPPVSPRMLAERQTREVESIVEDSIQNQEILALTHTIESKRQSVDGLRSQARAAIINGDKLLAIAALDLMKSALGEQETAIADLRKAEERDEKSIAERRGRLEVVRSEERISELRTWRPSGGAR